MIGNSKGDIYVKAFAGLMIIFCVGVVLMDKFFP
jgi:hypothetical protein